MKIKNSVSEKITNNRGIAFLIPIILILMLCVGIYEWFDMFQGMGFFQDKAEITRQRELTERARIDAAAFNQNLILFLTTGREIIFILAVGAAALMAGCFMMTLIITLLAHRQEIHRIDRQIQAGIVHQGMPETINYQTDTRYIGHYENIG